MLSLSYGYLFSLGVALASAASNITSNVDPSSPIVTVKNGSYIGVHNSAYNQDFFLGIPYAQVCLPAYHVICADSFSHRLVICALESLKV